MKTSLILSALAVGIIGAAALTPVAADAMGGHGNANGETKQLRDGSGSRQRTHAALTEQQREERRQQHQADGTCDGSSDQQRLRARAQ